MPPSSKTPSRATLKTSRKRHMHALRIVRVSNRLVPRHGYPLREHTQRRPSRTAFPSAFMRVVLLARAATMAFCMILRASDACQKTSVYQMCKTTYYPSPAVPLPQQPLSTPQRSLEKTRSLGRRSLQSARKKSSGNRETIGRGMIAVL